MTAISLPQALTAATAAAREAGALMRQNWRRPKKINAAYAHDLKLELDVRCQKRITRALRSAFPETALLGEEGVTGDPQQDTRWVVDPIDGTVNFAYGIPHACVSIALQTRAPQAPARPRSSARPAKSAPVVARAPEYRTVLGVVYDPFCDELFTACAGQPARLNGRKILASNRRTLAEAVISLGFGKHDEALNKLLPDFQKMAYRVRKIRVLGSAALDLAYVAAGRLDAYLETGLRLWDIAAGGFIVERAGGVFSASEIPNTDGYQVTACNAHLRRALAEL